MAPSRQIKEFFMPKTDYAVYVEEINGRRDYSISSIPPKSEQSTDNFILKQT
jgi:hypothetical protein